MATITRQLLSGSTDGLQIKVTGTGTGSTVTVHTADATAEDHIYLYADNDSTSDVLLTLEWGGTTDPDNLMKITIPARGVLGLDGPKQIVPGLPLTNSKVLKAFAATANVIKLSGFVNRMT